jgi:hypothetical protein
METKLGAAAARAIGRTCSSAELDAFISRRRTSRPLWIGGDRAYFARIRLFLASWVSSARPSASRSGGMYIPNLPR